MRNDFAWKTRSATELDRRRTPGAEVGAALAEVESHLADAQEGADTAFGDPVDYAASLALPARKESRLDALRGLRVGLLLPAALITPWASKALIEQQPTCSPWLAQVIAGFAMICFEIVDMGLALARPNQQRSSHYLRAKSVGDVFGILAVALAPLLSGHHYATLPTLPTLIVGIVCAVAGAWLGWTVPQQNKVVFPDRPQAKVTNQTLHRTTISLLTLTMIIGVVAPLIP